MKAGFTVHLKDDIQLVVSENKNQQGLTAFTRARMIGNPKAETTIPVVKK